MQMEGKKNGQRHRRKWRHRDIQINGGKRKERDVTENQGHSWKEAQDKLETNGQSANSLLPRLSSGARK